MSNLMRRDWNEESGKLPAWKVAGCSFLDVCCVMDLLMLPLLVYFFMNAVIGGVAAGVVCAVLMLAVCAAVSAVASKLVKRTNGKFGKCRPFLVIGNVLMLITGVLVFAVTDKLPDSAVVRAVFFGIFTALFMVGFAFQTMAVLAGHKCLPTEKKEKIIFAVSDVVLVIGFAALAVVLSGVFKEINVTASWNILTWTSFVSMILGVFCIAKRDMQAFYN